MRNLNVLFLSFTNQYIIISILFVPFITAIVLKSASDNMIN